MKKLKRYKLFESTEDKVDVDFIKDCFVELQDEFPIKVEVGEVLGHSSVTVTICYWKYKFNYSDSISYSNSKNKVIDNLIKDTKEELQILEKVDAEIDRILETFDYKVSISDYLYKNNNQDDPFEIGYDDDGYYHRKKLEIVFVKMKQ